jgi:hypothetical protein
MMKFLLLPIVLFLLCGCSFGEQEYAGLDLTLESDHCRAAALSSTDLILGPDGRPVSDSGAAYAKAYRDCMRANGYTLNDRAH